MKKYKVIANPTAGHGTALRAIPILETLLKKHQLDYEIVRTERPGHAIELAREAAVAGFDVVVSAGGDGTANEVINGLMEAKQLGHSSSVLGVIGIGRGNDFSHAVGIPHDLEQACQVLVADHRRAIDIGRVIGGIYPQGRFFGNVVGVGFDAIATIEVMKLPRWGGFLSFLLAVLRTIFLYSKGPTIEIKYDGKTITQPCLLVSVMNGQRLGGGFWLAPNSKPDDGLFDLCIAHEVSQLRVFRLILYFLKGTQATQPEITMDQATHISITAQKGSLPAETDGEIICIDGQHLEVELLPKHLEVVCQAS